MPHITQAIKKSDKCKVLSTRFSSPVDLTVETFDDAYRIVTRKSTIKFLSRKRIIREAQNVAEESLYRDLGWKYLNKIGTSEFYVFGALWNPYVLDSRWSIENLLDNASAIKGTAAALSKYPFSDAALSLIASYGAQHNGIGLYVAKREQRLSESTQQVIADSNDLAARVILAKRYDLTEKMMWTLAQDPHPNVREALIKSRNKMPDGVIDLYTNDSHTKNRHYAAANYSSFNTESWELLANDPDPAVRYQVSNNPGCPDEYRVLAGLSLPDSPAEIPH